eukprot:5258399-Amphidinium_carterae.1
MHCVFVVQLRWSKLLVEQRIVCRSYFNLRFLRNLRMLIASRTGNNPESVVTCNGTRAVIVSRVVLESCAMFYERYSVALVVSAGVVPSCGSRWCLQWDDQCCLDKRNHQNQIHYMRKELVFRAEANANCLELLQGVPS